MKFPREKTHKQGASMKHLLSLISALSLVTVTGICSAQVASGPSVALPPAEVILNAAKEMGVEAVGGDYVISKMDELINKSGKVFVIDARPARNYDDGFIPTAFNMYDAKFKLIYPELEKLNLAKDTEIFIGVGRPCPMSLGDIKQLKAKGFTNLKAFVKGPVFFERYYSEVTVKGAKKHASNGALVINLAEDADLGKFLAANSEKDKVVILAGPADNARTNYVLADKAYKAGYTKTAVFNGNIKDIQ
jgi:rhodanese-related sulfurtransferase